MIKKTITTLSVVALAAGTLALPAAAAGISSDAPVQIAACGPCKAKNPCAAKNPCNPCKAKNPCAAKNPCNPCKAKNPCNPCGAKKKM